MDIAAQRKKAEDFLALHRASGILALCNTSDVAGARIVVEAGFPAVASSSAGVAWMMGYPDGEIIPREEMLGAVRRIAETVDVPVTADMEAGYGHAPEVVAETVRLTMEAGAVGLNIEDSDAQSKGHPLLDFELSVERIRAAKEAADASGIPMVINARTDGFYGGGNDRSFGETVRRGNRYLEAGAGCVFVPFVRDAKIIGELCREIDGPVNILAGAPSPTLSELQELGVARVSIGGLLSLAAATVVRKAAEELRDHGTYGFAKDLILHPEMNALLVRRGD
jgi:2-methylisocitrate lyase-like PEP mutase family enzyme